jgi:retron-type reverse transcriptase
VVQTADKLVLEPIFEAELDPAAYGYRPGRSGTDAIKAVHALLCRGFTDVVDADLAKYRRYGSRCDRPCTRSDAASIRIPRMS